MKIIIFTLSAATYSLFSAKDLTIYNETSKPLKFTINASMTRSYGKNKGEYSNEEIVKEVGANDLITLSEKDVSKLRELGQLVIQEAK